MLNHTNNYNEISLKDTEPGSHSNIVNILVYINKFPIKKMARDDSVQFSV